MKGVRRRRPRRTVKKSKPAPKKTQAPAKGKTTAKAAKPAKPAAKAAPAKAKPKAAAKPAKATAKAAPKKAAKPETKKAVAPKAKAKATPAPKAKAAAPAAKAAKPLKAAKAAPVKETKATKAPKAVEAKETKETKVAKTKAEPKAKESAKAAAPVAEAFPALDADVKRPAKPFFMEVKPGVERVIKRGDKSAVSQVIDLQARRKGPTAEESAEELAERIERELQSQSFLKRARLRPQMCTKCGINEVTPRFTIDRELGYCELCAEILHLGETKEARRMEVSLAVKKEDGEEGEDESEGPSPDEVEDIPEDVD